MEMKPLPFDWHPLDDRNIDHEEQRAVLTSPVPEIFTLAQVCNYSGFPRIGSYFLTAIGENPQKIADNHPTKRVTVQMPLPIASVITTWFQSWQKQEEEYAAVADRFCRDIGKDKNQ